MVNRGLRRKIRNANFKSEIRRAITYYYARVSRKLAQKPENSRSGVRIGPPHGACARFRQLRRGKLLSMGRASRRQLHRSFYASAALAYATHFLTSASTSDPSRVVYRSGEHTSRL